MENEQTYPELEKAKAEQEKLKLHHLSIDLTLEGMPGEIDLPKGERGERGQDGFTPVVTVTDNEDGSHLITITQPEGREPITTTIKDGKVGPAGERGLPGVAGSPGRDGFTPEVTVTDREDGSHVITITQPDGRAPITTTIKDGKAGVPGRDGVDGVAGSPGRDGFTPEVTVTDREDGSHVITITQPDGRAPITTTIKDGKPGAPGRDGVDGQSITGAKGDPGRDGFTPVITVTDKEDGSHVITITQPDGRAPITTTIKDGKAGAPGRDGRDGDTSETLVVADMYRFDKVEKVETFCYFTPQNLSKFLYTNIQYYPQKLDWAHWWSDIKSTSDITVDVPLKSLGGASVVNTSGVTVIDKDGRIYEVYGAYDNGGYAPNPGGYKTRFYKYAIRGDALMKEPATDEYMAVWNFLNSNGNPEQYKSYGGYLYTIVRLTSRKGKTAVFVTKQYRPNNKNF